WWSSMATSSLASAFVGAAAPSASPRRNAIGTISMTSAYERSRGLGSVLRGGSDGERPAAGPEDLGMRIPRSASPIRARSTANSARGSAIRPPIGPNTRTRGVEPMRPTCHRNTRPFLMASLETALAPHRLDPAPHLGRVPGLGVLRQALLVLRQRLGVIVVP